MINRIDNHLHRLSESHEWTERVIATRLIAIFLTAIVPVEAGARCLHAAIMVVRLSAYATIEPFSLVLKVLQVKRGTLQASDFFNKEKKILKTHLIVVARAIYCVASIVLTPLVGLLSPRAMVQLHCYLGLAKLPEPKPLLPVLPVKDVLTAASFVNEAVKKNINEKFIALRRDQNECARLQKYGLKPPNSILLYGPSNYSNKKAAEHIAAQLGKDLKELDVSDEKEALTAWNRSHSLFSIAYFTGKKVSDQNLKKIGSLFDKLEKPYIMSVEQEKGHLTKVKVQVTLPDEEVRKVSLKNGLYNVPCEEGFDMDKVVRALDGFSIQKIDKVILEIKERVYQTNGKISTEIALDVAKGIKSVKNLKKLPPKADDFVGMEELHETFDLYLQVLQSPCEARDYGVKLPAGILLYGSPGCGKTYTAKHLCDYARSKGVALNFQELKGSDVATKWKGEGMQKIRAVFEEAKKNAPIILFIDECEGLFPSREKLKDTLSSERTQELDEVLQMLEQAKEHNIIIIGATNQTSYIDPAILRTGRFDYTFEVKPPNADLRLKMLEAKLKSKKCAPLLDLTSIVKNTEGFAASDIETVINTAGLESWKQKIPISLQLLEKAVEIIKNKKTSLASHTGRALGQPPILHELKKGVDALRQFVGNLDSMRSDTSAANDAV